MSEERSPDEAMFRRYLLGELNESEEEAFEKELMTSDDRFQELLIVEDEVVDDFLAGELSASQEREYRKRFLSTLERRHQHRFGAALRKNLRATKAKKSAAPSTDRNLAKLLPWLWRPALAAAIVALVAIGLWSILPPPPPFRLEQTAEGVEGPTVAFFLPRGSLRGTEPETSFSLPLGVNFVELQLELPAGARGDHEVTLQNPRSDAILAEGTLPARTIDGQQVVVANVPSKLLVPGEYRVLLHAPPRAGRRDAVATYEFRILSRGPRGANDADPETLFADAEKLRLAYEKDASQQAISKYGDARAAWIRGGDHARAATASRMLGATYEQLGLLEDALREYLEAMSLCRDSCADLLKSAIQSDVGVTQAKLADSDESLHSALQQCQRALSLARRAGGLREEAEALTCAGEVEYHQGNVDEALGFYRQATSVWESDADPRGMARSLFYEGTARSDLSQFAEAKANLEGALSLWTSSRDVRGEAMAHIALGRLEHLQGKYQFALNHFRQALDRLEPTGDLVWEASGLAGTGNVYFDLGNGAQARSSWEAALERYQKTGIHTATWELLLLVGRAHLALEDPSQALHRFQEALTLAESMKSDRWKQAYSLHFMSLAHQSLGDPHESLKLLERSLVLQRSARDPRLEAAIWAAMGNAQELLGSNERAAESFRRALELNKASNDRVGEAMALFGMARVARSRNDIDAARDYLERSLRVTESLREEVKSHELRTSYFASIYPVQELYVDVLMQLHNARPRDGLSAAAFEATERARARSLLESLTEAGVDIRAGVDPFLLERESSLKRLLEAIVERGAPSQRINDEKAAEAPDSEIRDLEEQYDLVRAEIRSKSPRYSALTRREPLDLAEVQEQLLDDDTLLLEYALGEERSYLWAVSKREYASFELSPRADIERQAERLYELLTAPAHVGVESLQERKRRLEKADVAYWEAGTRLSQMLLGPVGDRMAGKKRLLVVADGALQYLPLGALPLPGSGNDAVPMIVEHEIVNLPSASTLAVLRQEALGRERPKRTVAVFADPVFAQDDPRLDVGASKPSEIDSGVGQALRDIGFLRSGELSIPRLEATRQEAAEIVDAAPPGTTFSAIDFDANRSAAMSGELGRYRIVHFATHSVSNIDIPAMSGILLSMFDYRGQAQDGFLRLYDIYDLDLSADLVVLSACNTALGKRIRGEGTVGIVRAFMYAGAERVVATLWKVDDEATRELMSRFYREMFEARRSPSAALRNAQLAMWREREWRSPFFWAAFVLQGEWR